MPEDPLTKMKIDLARAVQRVDDLIAENKRLQERHEKDVDKLMSAHEADVDKIMKTFAEYVTLRRYTMLEKGILSVVGFVFFAVMTAVLTNVGL